jgi:hypothetical protein
MEAPRLGPGCLLQTVTSHFADAAESVRHLPLKALAFYCNLLLRLVVENFAEILVLRSLNEGVDTWLFGEARVIARHELKGVGLLIERHNNLLQVKNTFGGLDRDQSFCHLIRLVLIVPFLFRLIGLLELDLLVHCV